MGRSYRGYDEVPRQLEMNPEKLIIIDRLFYLLYSILRFILTKRIYKSSQSNQYLVIKLMGLGSLTFLAKTIEENLVDKKKIILITFYSNKEICELLKFENAIYIRHNNAFNLAIDCFKILVKAKEYKSLPIVDLERGSFAVGTFRMLLGLVYNSKVTCFENKKAGLQRPNFVSYPINTFTIQEMFKLGMQEIPKVEPNRMSTTIAVQKNKVLVNCNASNYLLARRYPKEKFISVIETLYQINSKTQFYFTGSKIERSYVDTIANELSIKGITVKNVAGVWSLPQLSNELSNCAFLITCDSAPLHLAIYLAVPTIAIWGPTRPMQFGYDELNFVKNVYYDIHCSPCLTHLHSSPTKACKGAITCLKDLESSKVIHYASQLKKITESNRVISFHTSAKVQEAK